MKPTAHPVKLTTETLLQGAAHLAAADPDLERVVADLGPPPLWDRAPGFPTLVHIILEQQVSLASARAAFDRLSAAAGALTPEGFLAFSDGELKIIGFSRQKTAYCRELARAVCDGDIDLAALETMTDGAVRSRLTRIRGIGPWTAEIYLLMGLLRPDTWPSGDLALATAVHEIKGIASRPGPAEMAAIARPWRPWRAVAARVLWHYYLNGTR